MARAPSKRVLLNLAALDKLQFAVAVGVERMCQEVLDQATPKVPRGADVFSKGSTITRKHTRDSGGYLVLNGSRKVGGNASKPNSFDTRRKGIISGVVGYGSPLAHLIERGTVGRVQYSTSASPPDEQRYTGAMPATPFLLPAVTRVVHDMAPTIGRAIAEAGFTKPDGAA